MKRDQVKWGLILVHFDQKWGLIIYLAKLKKEPIGAAHLYYTIYRKLPLPRNPEEYCSVELYLLGSP